MGGFHRSGGNVDNNTLHLLREIDTYQFVSVA